MTPEDKVRILRELTRGADDVYALRGEEHWRPVYGKLNDSMLVRHLTGDVEVGSYPLLPTGNELPTVWWIAADFDGKRTGSDWESDVTRATSFMLETGCSILVNRSRSGDGAHVRAPFKEPVPAWMARRWMTAWLEEAQVVREEGDSFDVPSSFDRLIPPQDTLLTGLTKFSQRRPGNLIGSPLNGKLARRKGGTLPICPEMASKGKFEPDGRHWFWASKALEERSWGVSELRAGLAETPGVPDLNPPAGYRRLDGAYALRVIKADDTHLDFSAHFCEFFKQMAEGKLTYELWVALASQLHRFGEAGKGLFHQISSTDPRYDPDNTEMKWDQTSDMMPVRCDTLASKGWTCPHLRTERCGGAMAPSYFHDHQEHESL
jgi:hypothetical protein